MEKIYEIRDRFVNGELDANEAFWQVLDLFAVMQRSEQLPCERCKKLEFMIENGLGWKDMENDCT